MAKSKDKNTSGGWRGTLTRTLAGGLRERAQLLELLREANKRGLLDADAMAMVEGALTMAELQARDVMVARAEMVCIRRPRDRQPCLGQPSRRLQVATAVAGVGSRHGRGDVRGRWRYRAAADHRPPPATSKPTYRQFERCPFPQAPQQSAAGWRASSDN